MYEIATVGFDEILPLIQGDEELLELLSVAKIKTVDRDENEAFVQILEGDVPHEIERDILRFERLSQMNTPVGLPLDFRARTLDGGVLIFPLAGFRRHIQHVAKAEFELYERAGSMDALVQSRGDSLTGVEYLVGGLLACIDYAEEERRALVFSW